jgi:cell fate regulator YaaT (PSP1 superfamily)
VLRLATPDDERRAAELRAQDEETRRKVREKVKQHDLIMKVSDAEWQWDKRKLTIYFTAERRVDFRALVRDLAAAFRTRIELKQIGVRDEAKRLSGIGRCGREYCSASWLPELRPVNLQVAKDQRLSLNPSQISGACGRLMCCLRYEHDFYAQARKRFPKEGRVLITSRGEEKVVSNDIFNDRVTLRALDGETRIVPLAELKAEQELRSPLAGVREEDDATPIDVIGADDGIDVAPDDEIDEVLEDSAASDAVSDAAPATEVAGDDRALDRRPHRRRGRRGGRRSRPGGEAK